MHSRTIKLLAIAFLFFSTFAFSQVETFSLDGKDHKTHTYKSNTGVTNTELEYRGKIVFTEDETDVKYISPGGFLRFGKRSFGNKRSIILEGESNGGIYREYREGSKKLPFEPAGKKWMASVLPEIIRTTGIGAEERVIKFYKKGGMDALLVEIDQLSSDYIKEKYYDASFKIPSLKVGEMVLLINDAGNKVSSSYELSKLFTENSDVYSKDEQSLAAVINITNKISSSYEQAKVYKHLLSKTELADQHIGLIIKNVRNIRSSYEQSGVLQRCVKKPLNAQNIKLAITEVEHISSSYEQSKVMQAILNNQTFSKVDLTQFLAVVSNINSSYEQSKVLGNIIAGNSIPDKYMLDLIEAIDEVSSSYEQSKLLQKIGPILPTDQTIRAAFFRAAEGLSDYEYGKVMRTATHK